MGKDEARTKLRVTHEPGPSVGTGAAFGRWAAGTLAFGGSSSRACRPHSTWLVLVQRGPSWPFSVCASAGLPVVLMGTGPQRQRPAPCCPGQRSWVSPALVLLRIWLQASGVAALGGSLTLPEGASLWRSRPPPPLLAGHWQCHSQDHPGDHLSGLQSKHRGKALPGG